MNDKFMQTYAESLRGDPAQNRKAASVVLAFLQSAGNRPLDRQAVDKRIEEMVKGGYADGTINWQFRIIRASFRANGVEWPFRHGEAPKIREREVIALAMDDKLVRKLIHATRLELLKPKHQRRLMPYDGLYLALSTTYAMRCSELAQLSREEINSERHLIYVETKKHGRQRYHSIPPQIRGYVYDALPDLAPKTPQCLNRVFRRIERLARVPHTDDLAWHGFRRMIDRRLLQAGLETQAVTNFLRWKRSSSDMADRYYGGLTVVGGEQTDGIEIGTGDSEIDDRAFAHHPFLPFWEEDLDA